MQCRPRVFWLAAVGCSFALEMIWEVIYFTWIQVENAEKIVLELNDVLSIFYKLIRMQKS